MIVSARSAGGETASATIAPARAELHSGWRTLSKGEPVAEV
jgi:hypothetical protein